MFIQFIKIKYATETFAFLADYNLAQNIIKKEGVIARENYITIC
jgi:hypothetical protein